MKSLTDKQLLLLRTLRRNYPLAFPETPVPLKAGILEDMKAEIQDFGGNCIKKLIIFYCRQEDYLQVVADAEPGTARVALDGSPATTVTEEHIEYSRKKLNRLRQKMIRTGTSTSGEIRHAALQKQTILSLKQKQTPAFTSHPTASPLRYPRADLENREPPSDA